MEELDLLKKDWKRKENSFSQLSEKELYGMLHRKSSSIVKWILIISILELCLWTGIGFLFTDDYVDKVNHSEMAFWLKVLNYLNYAVVLAFIYLFYKNYVNISTTSSTRKLMKDILKTRKTVQYYVWYNLGMIALCLVIGFIMTLSWSPKVADLRNQIEHDDAVLLKAILFMSLIVIIIVGVFWLVYRLLYGILLRKLYANYKELEKIDLD